MAWDRSQTLRKRSVPMRLLNLGMSRTGTTSMCTALEILGLKSCYHLDYDSDDCAFWIAAMEAKFYGKGNPFGRAEWDHIFADNDVSVVSGNNRRRLDPADRSAISDLPAILFGPELASAYPDAKVLLTVRDTESWHRSMLNTVCHPVYRGWYHRGPAWFFTKEKALCDMSDLCEEITWKGDCAQFGKAFYEKYNDSVRAMMLDEHDQPLSQRRFLEWQLGEGWAKLAAFLGLEVPRQDYPSGNGVVDFHNEADAHTKAMWTAVVWKTSTWTLPVAILLAGALWMRVKLQKGV